MSLSNLGVGLESFFNIYWIGDINNKSGFDVEFIGNYIEFFWF